MFSKHILYKFIIYIKIILFVIEYVNQFNKKNKKYKRVRIFPVLIKGSSTGRAPIQVKRIIIIIKIQNSNLFKG